VRGKAILIVGLVAVSSAAAANPLRPPDSASTTFWEEMVDPHSGDVELVSGKIQQILDVVSALESQQADIDGRMRDRLFDDARTMARYLRKLAPANPEVLRLVGIVADESGRTQDALEALTAYLALASDSPATSPSSVSDATLRLGRISLRMGKHDDALRRFRQVATDKRNVNAQIHLANALAITGREDEALDVLARTPPESALARFALAVTLDRDEQIGAAFEELERLQSHLPQYEQLGELQTLIEQLRLVPAADAHYYRALLYESSDHLDEARSSWLLYAATGEHARFRRRALAHVRAIDALMESRMTKARRRRDALRVPRRYSP